MNVRLLRRIAKVIQEKPKEFNMSSWHRDKVAARAGIWSASVDALCELPKERRISCTTTHCIAGWAQVLSPDRNCKELAEVDAMRLLDIHPEQAMRLFHGCNWPSGYGKWRATAAQAAARIEHFIKTKGAE
jgi:hypothetical protein